MNFKKVFIKTLFFLIPLIPGILQAQNTGIGIINPTRGRLEVSGAVGTTSGIFGGDGAGISVQRGYPAIGFNQYHSTGPRTVAAGNALVQYLDMPTGSLAIDTYVASTQPNAPAEGQTRRITIRQNGNVSVNGGEGNASLMVFGSTIGITAARLRGTTYNTVFCDRVTGQSTQHTYINAGKNGGHVFINDQGIGNVLLGNGTSRVGINSQTPAAVLELKQVAARGLLLVAPANGFNNWEFVVNHEINETGSDLWVYYNTQYKGNFFHIDGLYYQASDRRLKTNIEEMPSVLSKVLQLQPVEYVLKFHNPGRIKSIGFISQQVRELFPELASIIPGDQHGYTGITDLYSMNYDGLGPIVLKAIQEQQQQIKSLQKRNADLRSRLEKAESAFAAIQ